MEEKVKISILLELYGNLLTAKQNEFMNYYYNQDLSLSEIADNNKITRQAVNTILTKSKNKLENYEKKLQFMQKEENIKEQIEKLKQTKKEEEKKKIIEILENQIDF